VKRNQVLLQIRRQKGGAFRAAELESIFDKFTGRRTTMFDPAPGWGLPISPRLHRGDAGAGFFAANRSDRTRGAHPSGCRSPASGPQS